MVSRAIVLASSTVSNRIEPSLLMITFAPLHEFVQEITCHPQTILRAGTNVVNWNDFPSEGGCCACGVALDRLFRLTTSDHNRRDAPQSDPHVHDPATLPA